MNNGIGLWILMLVAIVGLIEIFVPMHKHIKIAGAVLVVIVVAGYIVEWW